MLSSWSIINNLESIVNQYIINFIKYFIVDIRLLILQQFQISYLKKEKNNT